MHVKAVASRPCGQQRHGLQLNSKLVSLRYAHNVGAEAQFYARHRQTIATAVAHMQVCMWDYVSVVIKMARQDLQHTPALFK